MRRIALYISIVLMAVGCSQEPLGEHHSGEVSIEYLRTFADHSSQCIKSDMWIKGCVVLNDKRGESYKSFVLYDGTAGIEVKLDVESVERIVPLGSEVTMRCEGLYIGREGERIVLGAKPTGEYVVDRIAEVEVANRLSVSSCDASKYMSESMAIADLCMAHVSRFVRIERVSLVDEQAGLAWCDCSATDEPFASSMRYFTDGCDTLAVATLNRCHYATETIPVDVVTLVGVVDSYDGAPVLRLSDRRASLSQ